ncbi:MAG: cation transporter [Bacteroidia bacterium]|nr:cation transporter [Bacteroidia bacterium]
MNRKVATARLSIISNVILILSKLGVGIITGSVSIISEMIHSTMDLLAALIAFFAVKISDVPPDKDHPYGHGKYENISGVTEAILIFIASIWIIYEAVKKIISHEQVESIGIGFIVMVFSAVVNFIVSRKLYKVAKETDSIALEADALHLKVDVYTSLGVAVGLLIIWLTGLNFLDPVVAILVAIFILRESFILLKKAYKPLLDSPLENNEISIIEGILATHYVKYHNLRTRRAGNYKFVDFHLEMSENLSVKESHDICDTLESEIQNAIKNSEVTIHVECECIQK